MGASFSSSSSSSFTSTYLSDAAAAKSLTASMAAAAAERGARYISSILSNTDDEEAIPPAPMTTLPRRDKGKRKMYEFFDEAPPIETRVSTRLTLSFATPPAFEQRKNAVGPSPNMARSSYAFTSEGTPADEIVPSLSLHFGSPRTSKSKKNAIGLRPNWNMARSSFPSSTPSEVNPADEKAPTQTTGVSTRLSLHFAGPPTSKQTKNPIGPHLSPNMARSSFSSSPNLSDAQFDEGKGKTSQLFDFFASEGKVAVDTTTLPIDETGVSIELSLFHFPDPPKKTAVVSPRYSPPGLPEDRWEIKKVLKKSDVDDSSRLLLAKDVVHEHILPHVIGNGPGPDEGQGVEVAVWDMDKGSEHVLVLKKWKSGSFVLVKNWMSDFVRRRGLEKDDEIGLRWDDGNSRFEFTVLKKK